MLEVQQQKLEQIAGITSDEAKNFLIQSMEAAAKRDAALMIRRIDEDARRTAEKTSQEVIAYAIQRYAGDYVAEHTVSVVNLPNDEMKGTDHRSGGKEYPGYRGGDGNRSDRR